MGPPSSKDDSGFVAARILGGLRVSASEFGYRAQALLAEALRCSGCGIDKVARVGHPDIIVRVAGRILRLQSKATGQTLFALSAVDLEGIRPRSRDEEGYLAVLDRGPPVTWTCVRYAKARVLVGRTVPLAMLKAMEDEMFSAQCTTAFVELIVQHRDAIEAFTFSLISRRALKRDS